MDRQEHWGREIIPFHIIMAHAIMARAMGVPTEVREDAKVMFHKYELAFEEILVEKVHKFSSSGGELKEGHDALNLCQAEEEFREERAHF